VRREPVLGPASTYALAASCLLSSFMWQSAARQGRSEQHQGLTLVHFSAHHKRLLWDTLGGPWSFSHEKGSG